MTNLDPAQDRGRGGPHGPRQTLSYLRMLFDQRGIRPKNKLGQNFLIDLNLLELLIQAANLNRDDLVLEVGGGTGGLTSRLAGEAGAVLSIEIDPSFCELIRDAVRESDKVRLLHIDALRHKNEINPVLFQNLDELRQRSGCRSLKLVSNLPYAVAVPVVANLLISDYSFDCMVVTVQWEIAERLLAAPDSKDYGALAVLVQSIADVSLVRKLPPTAFWPRPQVSSAIVKIVPSTAKRANVVERVGSVANFRTFLRELYVHRRKNLRGALVGKPSGRRGKDEVDRKLAELGLDATTRAEDLDVEQHLRLCVAFAEDDETNAAD